MRGYFPEPPLVRVDMVGLLVISLVVERDGDERLMRGSLVNVEIIMEYYSIVTGLTPVRTTNFNFIKLLL